MLFPATHLCSFPKSSRCSSRIVGCVRNHTGLFLFSTTSTGTKFKDQSELLQELRTVDTSALCDADKALRGQKSKGEERMRYDGIKVMDYRRIRPMNHPYPSKLSTGDVDIQIIMAGVARTVQFTESNDFLPVLRGLQEANEDEVLVVNTMDSTRAVAGEIFCAEAHRKGLAGIVIDGPIRDTRHLSKYPPVRFYARCTTPYSGFTQSVGTMQKRIVCGGVSVQPGDIVVGDEDGVLVGSDKSFKQILPLAKQIQETEQKLLDGIGGGTHDSISDLSNYQEHIQQRIQGNNSTLEFRV